MSDYSISAEITIFGEEITLTPNSEVPHRIESVGGMTIKAKYIDEAIANFGLSNIPGGFKISNSVDSISVSELIIDTRTKDFQIACSVDFTNSWLNDLASDVFTIQKVNAYASCKTENQ